MAELDHGTEYFGGIGRLIEVLTVQPFRAFRAGNTGQKVRLKWRGGRRLTTIGEDLQIFCAKRNPIGQA